MIYTQLYSATCPLGLPQRFAWKRMKLIIFWIAVQLVVFRGVFDFSWYIECLSRSLSALLFSLCQHKQPCLKRRRWMLRRLCCSCTHNSIYYWSPILFIRKNCSHSFSVFIPSDWEFLMLSLLIKWSVFSQSKKRESFCIKYLTVVYVVWKLKVHTLIHESHMEVIPLGTRPCFKVNITSYEWYRGVVADGKANYNHGLG